MSFLPKSLTTKSKTGVDLYHNGKQIDGFVSIDPHIIYLSKDGAGRTYWYLGRIPSNKLPKISFNDSTYSIRISTWRIDFKTRTHYLKAKAALCPYYNNCSTIPKKRTSAKRHSFRQKSKKRTSLKRRTSLNRR